MDRVAGLAQRAATIAQVLVPNLQEPTVTAADTHHLEKVLRVRNGEVVSCVDGKGAWRLCCWRNGLLDAETPIVQVPEPAVHLGVAFPPLKGDRTELIVQKLTELGVARLQLLDTSRGVVRWDEDKADKQMVRLRRVLHDAAMQSRRVFLPSLLPPISVSEAVQQGFVLSAWGGRRIDAEGPSRIAIGPEGGWTPEELALSRGTVSLGPTVLRAETAAIATGALLMAAHAS